MDSETNLVPEIPIIITIEVVCGLIWLYIWNYNVDAKKFAFNYVKITQNKEWWRMLSSSLSHIQLMHLAFNLISLWNTGPIEKRYGSIVYFQITFLLFIISNASMILCYYILSKYLNKEEYVKNMYAVGYSAILFGFMSFECMLFNGNMNIFNFDIPYYLGPFVLLVLISVIVPSASFCGHFAGIIAGFILGTETLQDRHILRILFWLSFVQFIALMMYSIYRTDLCGVVTRANETLTSVNTIKRTTIVNGVIVRTNDVV
eukprot:130137_1